LILTFSFHSRAFPDQHYKDLENSYAQDFRSRAPGTKWVPNLQEIYADGGLAFVPLDLGVANHKRRQHGSESAESQQWMCFEPIKMDAG
jgi:hypothetical protein